MSDDLCFYLFAFSVPFHPNRSKPILQSWGPRVVCQRLADIQEVKRVLIIQGKKD